jgi:hypothetical protein
MIRFVQRSIAKSFRKPRVRGFNDPSAALAAH